MAAPALEATPSASSASSTATGTDWLADLGLASNSANVVVAGLREEEVGKGRETVTGSGSLALLLLLLLLLLCLEFDWQNCFTLSLVANYATCETVPAPLAPPPLSSPLSASLLCSPSAVNLCLKVDIMNLKVVLRWQRSATVAQRGV